MSILIGLAATLITILFNIYAGSALQNAFGSMGSAFAEIGFALIALATAVIYVVQKRRSLDRRHIEYGETDYTIESVFSFNPPKFRHIVGGLSLMFAGNQISVMYYNIVMRLFPETYAALNDSILESAYSGTFAATFCTIAIIPPICEELLLRGAIQKTFTDLKKPIYTILLSGFMFGLFHIDPMRIPFATMMGIILSYAYYRSGSIFVPILMHFANNAYSVITSWQYKDLSTEAIMAENAAVLSDPMTAAIAGFVSALAMMLIAACGIFVGASFLEPQFAVSLKKYRKVYLSAAICIAVLGAGMFVSILVFGF